MKNKINILVTFNLDEDEKERILGTSDRIQIQVTPAKKADEIPGEIWEAANVLFTQGLLPEPEAAPNLKWVQFRYAGIDPYLDHPIINNPDIIVTTMSGAIVSQVAEYVLMAILAMGKRLPRMLGNQLEKHWPVGKEKLDQFFPTDVRGSTVGIIGYGSLGRQVARLLQPFNASVLAVKNDVFHPEDSGYIPEGMGDPHGDLFTRLYPVEALESVLAESDFIVLTLPLTDSTFNIIDAQAFEKMKPTTYLINVGRGELINEQALVEALTENQIAGAVLDVFEDEPLPPDSPLWDLPNIIISPHISGFSRHYKNDTLKLFVENLSRYLAEVPLYNRVDPQKGY